MGRASTAPASTRALDSAVLGATVISGAAVMAVEILGTRVVAPVFGVDLFVWSALLSVTLLALAVGYLLGGKAADRWPGPKGVGYVLLGSGFLLGLSVLLRRPVLSAAQGLGPRVGPLVSAGLLFGPALTVMGMMGPLAIRASAHELAKSGRRVGFIYAISTAGSLAATLLVGFVFIPRFETRTIAWFVAIVLALAGGVFLASLRKLSALAAIAVVGLGLLPDRRALPEGLHVPARSQSLYGLLEVIEDDKRQLRVLRADHSLIGAQWMGDGSSAFDFVNIIALAPLLRPNAKDVLQIGLGIGSAPMEMARAGLTNDVVELDPHVVAYAKEFFGFTPNGQVAAEDGRRYLAETTKSYDIIVHDTFTGGTTPEHLLTQEAFSLVHARLRPNGVMVLNFVGHQRGPRAAGALATLATLRTVFKEVRAFRDVSPADGPDELSNIVFFASDSPFEFSGIAARAPDGPIARVAAKIADWELFRSEAETSGAPIVTDERNPLALLEMPTAAEHFSAMQSLLPREVWVE
jgi:MFS family permease